MILKNGMPLTQKEYRIIGYTSNVKKGTAKVFLAGTGDYGGLKTVKFKIAKKKWLSNYLCSTRAFESGCLLLNHCENEFAKNGD